MTQEPMILDQNIAKAFGVRAVAADVGVEIELEYKDQFDPLVFDDDGWTTVPDGSLRHGMEYRLKRPIKAAALSNAIDKLCGRLPVDQIRLSPRTSVHLHVNMTKKTLREVMNVYSGYLLYENMIFATQPGRKANHFCLRTIDAEGVYNQVLNSLKHDTLVSLFNNDMRYSGLNFCALSRYGSIEYRFLRGMHDPDTLKLWSSGLYYMTEQLSSLSTRDQLELASMGMDTLSAKVLTPEMARIVTPMYAELPEHERMSGFGYATGLAIALEAAPKKPVGLPKYFFDTNPDIDKSKTRPAPKKSRTNSIPRWALNNMPDLDMNLIPIPQPGPLPDLEDEPVPALANFAWFLGFNFDEFITLDRQNQMEWIHRMFEGADYDIQHSVFNERHRRMYNALSRAADEESPALFRNEMGGA